MGRWPGTRRDEDGCASRRAGWLAPAAILALALRDDDLTETVRGRGVLGSVRTDATFGLGFNSSDGLGCACAGARLEEEEGEEEGAAPRATLLAPPLGDLDEAASSGARPGMISDAPYGSPGGKPGRISEERPLQESGAFPGRIWERMVLEKRATSPRLSSLFAIAGYPVRPAH